VMDFTIPGEMVRSGPLDVAPRCLEVAKVGAPSARGQSSVNRATNYKYDRLNRLTNVDLSDSGTTDTGLSSRDVDPNLRHQVRRRRSPQRNSRPPAAFTTCLPVTCGRGPAALVPSRQSRQAPAPGQRASTLPAPSLPQAHGSAAASPVLHPL
jgi:hypothetical protein